MAQAPERIEADGALLACIVRADYAPEATTFVTTADLPMQIGFVVYPAGGEAGAHSHRPVERRLTLTPEVLFVRSGRCALDVYGEDRALVTTVELGLGDVVLLIAGGHGVRMLEDTVLLEIKQGPYVGVDEKVRFT